MVDLTLEIATMIRSTTIYERLMSLGTMGIFLWGPLNPPPSRPPLGRNCTEGFKKTPENFWTAYDIYIYIYIYVYIHIIYIE